MGKSFKKVPDAERRKKRIPILVNADEHARIEHLASVRDLSVAEYCRRSALQRRADVQIETQIILALSDATRAIRELRADFIEQGVVPPDEVLREVISGARDAMLLISK